MGANLDYRVYKTNDRKDIEKRFAEAVRADRFENGNSYSGGVGMLNFIDHWIDKRFVTEDEAVDYIDDKHKKWDPAMAVSFYYGEGEIGWVVGGSCSC